ncbi:cell division protein FtsW [Marinicauda algicola]|uniref:Probable peptidoglycan glycosyltransferase FtsW n=1 Tax=Marinicauda algicola TaxID=2029849 RepID=A0A4S2H2Z2_9PROT|nr:putative peptidoglycan glycosyltransferase FtsW [Marinicauda algicola]TGY89990.1 cell division protein FtsW [Marinicauda algicola]
MIAAPRSRFPALWRGLDRTLIFTVVSLIGIGLTLSLAAGPAAAERLSISQPFYFLIRHAVFAGAGVAILLFTAALSVTGVRRIAGLALAGSLIVMAALPVIGHEVNGATRWIRLGGFGLQPSEFLKPAFIVICAWLFAEESRGAPVPGRLLALGLYGLSVALLILQPDFGQTILLSAIFGAMLFAAGLPWLYTLALGGAGLGLMTLAYFSLDHVQARVAAFLSPQADWAQTERARQAFAEGGLFGVGPGEGEIKRLLPEAHTDFVFSVAAEEFGLLASLAIIGLYAILFAQAWSRAMKLTDHFAQLATAGLALLFGFQALINIAVNLNLIPPKGMTLPFISYGGSSMLALAFAAGLMLALTRHRPGAYERRS